MKIETTNALDATIDIDETTKTVTVKYTTLRGTFSQSVSLDTSTTPNGILIDNTKTGSGTADTVIIDLLRSIPSGTYSSVKITTLSSGRVPIPVMTAKKPFYF